MKIAILPGFSDVVIGHLKSAVKIRSGWELVRCGSAEEVQSSGADFLLFYGTENVSVPTFARLHDMPNGPVIVGVAGRQGKSMFQVYAGLEVVMKLRSEDFGQVDMLLTKLTRPPA